MGLAYYMDEHVDDAITRGLRARGVDVLRVQDDGHMSTDDEIVLDRARVLGRVVVTQDDDFLAIAHRRQATGVSFSGVVYAHQLWVSIGQCVKDLEILAGVCEPDEMRNKVEYLPL